MTHGSLQNLLAGSNPEITPAVGMGATKIGWSDRHPFTVITIVDAKTLVVQEDSYERTDGNGMSESQSYTFSPNPEGATYTITRRKNGQWVVQGDDTKNGQKFTVGSRDKYHDYSF